jgi:hypothetical protein
VSLIGQIKTDQRFSLDKSEEICVSHWTNQNRSVSLNGQIRIEMCFSLDKSKQIRDSHWPNQNRFVSLIGQIRTDLHEFVIGYMLPLKDHSLHNVSSLYYDILERVIGLL